MSFLLLLAAFVQSVTDAFIITANSVIGLLVEKLSWYGRQIYQVRDLLRFRVAEKENKCQSDLQDNAQRWTTTAVRRRIVVVQRQPRKFYVFLCLRIHPSYLTRCNTPFTRYNQLSNRLYNRIDNRLYRVNKHPTGCQPGCQTGLTSSLTTVLNEQPLFVQPVVKPGYTTGLTTGCIHDKTGCQPGLTTGLTTGCIV